MASQKRIDWEGSGLNRLLVECHESFQGRSYSPAEFCREFEALCNGVEITDTLLCNNIKRICKRKGQKYQAYVMTQLRATLNNFTEEKKDERDTVINNIDTPMNTVMNNNIYGRINNVSGQHIIFNNNVHNINNSNNDDGDRCFYVRAKNINPDLMIAVKKNYARLKAESFDGRKKICLRKSIPDGDLGTLNAATEDIIQEEMLMERVDNDPIGALRSLNDIVYAAAYGWICWAKWEGKGGEMAMAEKKDAMEKKVRPLMKDIDRIDYLVGIIDWILKQIPLKKPFSKRLKEVQRYYQVKDRPTKSDLLLLREKLQENQKKIKKRIMAERKTYDEWLENFRFMRDEKAFYRELKFSIDADPGNVKPKRQVEAKMEQYKDIEKLEEFWSTQWSPADVADRSIDESSEVLVEFDQMVRERIPLVDEATYSFVEKDIYEAIIRKKNWSACGDDKIPNYFWKWLRATWKVLAKNLSKLACERVVPEWFAMGRTTCLPKVQNADETQQRPITCLLTMYKLYTSILGRKAEDHVLKYKIMDPNQRGAKSRVWGTIDNLMLDRTVMQLIKEKKKDAVIAWWDMKKAYDSVDHRWLQKVLEIHRFPLWLQNAIKALMAAWCTRIWVGKKRSKLIRFLAGIFQGDSFCPLLFCLAINPISYYLSRERGIKLSRGEALEITHSLFIDDLKEYFSGGNYQDHAERVKKAFKMVGLAHNPSKCALLIIKKGIAQMGERIQGVDLPALEDNSTYKYLGIKQVMQFDVEQTLDNLQLAYLQRVWMIWSSNLCFVNKIRAHCSFAAPKFLYSMWTVDFNRRRLQEVDRKVRQIMYDLGVLGPRFPDAGLFLSRRFGGKEVPSVVKLYDSAKFKLAVHLLQIKDDLPMQKIVQIELERKTKNIFSKAVKIAGKLGIQLQIDKGGGYAKANGVDLLTMQSSALSARFNKWMDLFYLRRLREMKVHGRFLCKLHDGMGTKFAEEAIIGEHADLEEEETNSTMFGEEEDEEGDGVDEVGVQEDEEGGRGQDGAVTAQSNDLMLSKDSLFWVRKNCLPDHLLYALFDGMYQTTATKFFLNMQDRVENVNCTYPDCVARNLIENVDHIVSNCFRYLDNMYVTRHDNALKEVLKYLLKKYDIKYVDDPPLPVYDNSDVHIRWDVSINHSNCQYNRPDMVVTDHKKKNVHIIEFSVPFDLRIHEKTEYKRKKYRELAAYFRREYPGYKVTVIPILFGAFGAFEEKLKEDLLLIVDARDIARIIKKMQLIVVQHTAKILLNFNIQHRYHCR